ncbi:MAG: UTP--glucose-1-phosphate uridylyltransferase [Thermodesulfobacteriota bacterium]
MNSPDYQSAAHMQKEFEPFRRKMQAKGLPELVIDLFYEYYSRLLSGASQALIGEQEIQPVQKGQVPRLQDLGKEEEELGLKSMQQVVMIKLNGGLGTSMGMPYAKSLLRVKSEQTFLDLILEQARAAQDKSGAGSLALMNSFNTHQDTLDYLRQKGLPESEQPFFFLQNMYPKVDAKTLQPASSPQDPDLEWNPPGHGDIYAALVTSGVLDKLLQQGKRYAFISNADNLGAVIQPAILGYVLRQGVPFLMEVAQRTESDKKGGHLATLQDGRLILREIAQCPESDLDAFQDVQRYSYFNTNNIWLDLQKFQEYVQARGLPRLPLILNPKHLDPREEESPKVYQLETAMGAAISEFEHSGALLVGRDRFAPVKKTNDLLAVRSDCYILNQYNQLLPNPKRQLPQIKIDLDSDFYKLVDQFEARFPFGPPSLLQCESLLVQGDVLFERDVVCQSEVQLINRSSQQQRVKAGSVLKGVLEF